MPQDKESGLRASRYGKACARQIAVAIGATMRGSKSNECVWNEERALIKCAHFKTNSIGVLYHMIERIDCVLGALQDETGSYRILRLPMERCKKEMDGRPTRSQGPSHGRVGMIRRKTFEREGRLVANVEIEEP